MGHEFESKTNASLTKQETAIAAFEMAAEKFDGLSLTLDAPPARRMFVLADAMNRLDAALTPDVMRPIMSLMGSKVGFLTDRDKDKQKPRYTMEEVKEVVKEAILYGAHMTNNEVNIISGSMYAAKNHFMRKVREVPGLTDLEVSIGTPQNVHGETKVRCTARWKLRGKEQSIGLDEKMPCAFTIKVNNFMGADAVMGKASRKLYKRIYETATGSEISVPDGDVGDTAREIDAKVVDRASVNLDDIKAGDAANHKPVDEPLDTAPFHDFQKAYAKLNLLYDENDKAIDTALFKSGSSRDLPAMKDTADPKEIAAVIKTAKEFKVPVKEATQ